MIFIVVIRPELNGVLPLIYFDRLSTDNFLISKFSGFLVVPQTSGTSQINVGTLLRDLGPFLPKCKLISPLRAAVAVAAAGATTAAALRLQLCYLCSISDVTPGLKEALVSSCFREEEQALLGNRERLLEEKRQGMLQLIFGSF